MWVSCYISARTLKPVSVFPIEHAVFGGKPREGAGLGLQTEVTPQGHLKLTEQNPQTRVPRLAPPDFTLGVWPRARQKRARNAHEAGSVRDGMNSKSRSFMPGPKQPSRGIGGT